MTVGGWPPAPDARPAASRTGSVASSRARPAAWALAALLLAGCAGATGGGAARSAAGFGGAQQLLVLLEPGPGWQRQSADLAAEYGLSQVAAWTVAALDGVPCVVYAPARDVPLPLLLRRLASDPRVDVAQPLQRFRVLAEEGSFNDPYAELQTGVAELSLAAVHRAATGKGVKIGVVDTGVDLDHPDLRGRIAGAGNYVDQGERSFTSDVHGTAVAGILAAGSNNQVGIVGVAPGASVYAFKACWQDPPESRQAVCDSYTLARAMDAALAAKVQVLNLSLSGPPDPFLERLVGAALRRRTVVVTAWDGAAPQGGFPSSLEGVLAVGAQLRAGEAPPAARPPITAPAVDVLSTAPRGAYDFFNGSSFAAAHAAGVAALLLELRPELSPAEVRELLMASAGGEGDAPARLAPCAALARLTGRQVCPGS